MVKLTQLFSLTQVFRIEVGLPDGSDVKRCKSNTIIGCLIGWHGAVKQVPKRRHAYNHICGVLTFRDSAIMHTNCGVTRVTHC